MSYRVCPVLFLRHPTKYPGSCSVVSQITFVLQDSEAPVGLRNPWSTQKRPRRFHIALAILRSTHIQEFKNFPLQVRVRIIERVPGWLRCLTLFFPRIYASSKVAGIPRYPKVENLGSSLLRNNFGIQHTHTIQTRLRPDDFLTSDGVLCCSAVPGFREYRLTESYVCSYHNI